VIAFIEQLAKITENPFDGLDIRLIAVNQQFIAACSDINVEKRFEIFDVLILYAEKRVEALRW